MFEKFKLPLLFLGVFILGFSITYFSLTYFRSMNKTKSINNLSLLETPDNNLFEDVVEPEVPGDEFNAILLGFGGAGHSGGSLADSIIAINVQGKSKKVTLVSIPRDLWVPGNYKINATGVNAGVENFKGAVQNITGLPIEKYAAIDFSGLTKLIDTIGGIEVQLEKPYDDFFYPVRGLENDLCGKSPEEVYDLHTKYSGFNLEKQFECRYEHIHFDLGTTAIDGETALKFARSRHGDSDFGRSNRQFEILRGIIKKLATQSPFETISEAYKSLAIMVDTDLNLEEAIKLFDVFGNPEKYEIKQIQLTDENVLVSGKGSSGEYILLPRAGKNNYTGIKEYLDENIN